MVTELDYGLGNVTAALEAAGEPWLLALAADNGGPLEHSTNAPLRGGKVSEEENSALRVRECAREVSGC